MTTRVRRILIWSAVAGAVTVLVVLVIGGWMLRPSYLKRLVVEGLEKHTQLDTDVESISVSFLPRPRVTGVGLTMRIPNRPDLPPFISIATFHVEVGPFSALRRHVNTLHVDGLKVAVPPKDARKSLSGVNGSQQDGGGGKPEVIVDHLIAHDAELLFIRKEKNKRPLVFAIHDLYVDDVGFDRPMPFRAKLTNPVPAGLVDSRGTVGPWTKEDPTGLPVSGDYTFTDADLSTINGIGGTLTSTGTYTGPLDQISAKGTTDTPNFTLDLGGKPVRMTTTFAAVIDGTNGTVKLERVDAKLRNTAIVATGAITNLDGPGRHDVNLRVKIADGRIEDILALVVDSPTPMLVGDLSLESTLLLPPGKTRVPQRLQMAGRFGLDDARFTSAQVQTRLQELSRRSQGKNKEEEIGRVLTDLRGRFAVKNGLLALNDLMFQVPGATVALAGNYAIESGTLDFAGTLRMDATVSRAVGGFKSIFLKPFDPIFRKDGSGAVVPIKIGGTREAPKMGMEMGKVFGRGKK